MYEVDVAGQQVLDAVAKDGMRMSAAKFHQMIFALWIYRSVDDSRQPRRSGAVTEAVNVAHRQARFLDIQVRDGEAGMHDHIVADRNLLDQRDRNARANPADLDLDPLVIQQRRDPYRNSQAHVFRPRAARP